MLPTLRFLEPVGPTIRSHIFYILKRNNPVYLFQTREVLFMKQHTSKIALFKINNPHVEPYFFYDFWNYFNLYTILN